ncbi:MAG: hypothetical protein JXM68_01485, partial [Sedimentisphaerales bacterium]|nr:hypothetical protein [Sedimentisphaerales bacterium]
MQTYKKIISDKLLPRVNNPGQYIGGEVNQIVKDWDSCHTRVLLAFPDVYTIGMSNLGFSIIYDLVNQLDGVLAQRS